MVAYRLFQIICVVILGMAAGNFLADVSAKQPAPAQPPLAPTVAPVPQPTPNPTPQQPANTPQAAPAAPQVVSQPPARATLDSVAAWRVEALNVQDQQKFYQTLGLIPQTAQAVIDDVSSRIEVSYVQSIKNCETEGVSCVRYQAINNQVTVFSLHLLPIHAENDFLKLHEIAHAVDYAGISAEHMARFEAAFMQSPAWQRGGMRDQNGRLVPLAEVFADQFAIWVTEQDVATTNYGTPRLLTNAHFEQILLAAYTPGLSPLLT